MPRRISKQLYKALSAKGKRIANKYSKKQLKKLCVHAFRLRRVGVSIAFHALRENLIALYVRHSTEDPPEPDTPKFEKLGTLICVFACLYAEQIACSGYF